MKLWWIVPYQYSSLDFDDFCTDFVLFLKSNCGKHCLSDGNDSFRRNFYDWRILIYSLSKLQSYGISYIIYVKSSIVNGKATLYVELVTFCCKFELTIKENIGYLRFRSLTLVYRRNYVVLLGYINFIFYPDILNY